MNNKYGKPDDRLPESSNYSGEWCEIWDVEGQPEKARKYRWSEYEDRWVDMGFVKQPPFNDDIGEVGGIDPRTLIEWGETIMVYGFHPWDNTEHWLGDANTIAEYEQLLAEKHEWEMSQQRDDFADDD